MPQCLLILSLLLGTMFPALGSICAEPVAPAMAATTAAADCYMPCDSMTAGGCCCVVEQSHPTEHDQRPAVPPRSADHPTLTLLGSVLVFEFPWPDDRHYPQAAAGLRDLRPGDSSASLSPLLCRWLT